MPDGEARGWSWGPEVGEEEEDEEEEKEDEEKEEKEDALC